MTAREPMFLGDKAEASYLPTPMGGALSIWSGDGESIHLHLTDYRFGREAQRASALAALDTIAVAVQQALVALAPERFAQPEPRPTFTVNEDDVPVGYMVAQPGPDDPDDEPTDEPVIPADTGTDRSGIPGDLLAAPHVWYGDHGVATGGNVPACVPPTFAQAHPMTENELRAAWGDR